MDIDSVVGAVNEALGDSVGGVPVRTLIDSAWLAYLMVRGVVLGWRGVRRFGGWLCGGGAPVVEQVSEAAADEPAPEKLPEPLAEEAQGEEAEGLSYAASQALTSLCFGEAKYDDNLKKLHVDGLVVTFGVTTKPGWPDTFRVVDVRTKPAADGKAGAELKPLVSAREWELICDQASHLRDDVVRVELQRRNLAVGVAIRNARWDANKGRNQDDPMEPAVSEVALPYEAVRPPRCDSRRAVARGKVPVILPIRNKDASKGA